MLVSILNHIHYFKTFVRNAGEILVTIVSSLRRACDNLTVGH